MISRPTLWMSLEEPPSESEVLELIKKGVIDFHYDPTQDGAVKANEIIRNNNGNSIGYSPGMGSSEWKSKKRNLTTKPGKKWLAARVKMMMAMGIWTAMHLDEVDTITNSNDFKSITDTVTEASNNTMLVIPKNNVRVWAEFLETGYKVPHAIVENISFEEPNDINRLAALTDVYGVDFRKTGPKNDNKQAATLLKSVETATKYPIKGVFSMEQEFPVKRIGGFECRSAVFCTSSK